MIARAAAVAIVSSAIPSYAATVAEIDTARDRALAWLFTHQRGDGSWRGALGSEFIVTATAVEALHANGVRTYPFAAGTQWLGNAHPVSVDSLARQVGALTTAGMNVSLPAETLRNWRNPALGWGAYAKYETTFPDTALAVSALRIAQVPYSDDELRTALCLIASAQKTGAASVNGSWSYTRPPAGSPPVSVTAGAILPTVYNLLELDASASARSWPSIDSCNGTSYTVVIVIDAGLTWLLSQRGNPDGGFGESGLSTVLETTLVYQALAKFRPIDPATTAALDFLIARQRADGSWNGDALQTAMALKMLPPPSPVLADTDHDGIPDSVETTLGTNPNLADSRWLARGRGTAQLQPPTAANDFGLVATAGHPDAGVRDSAPVDEFSGLSHEQRRSGDRIPSRPPDVFAATVAIDTFGVDLFTGAARAALPLRVPSGAGGVAPALVLRYDTGSVDDLGAQTQATSTGLGWTLDAGPVIDRDMRNTVTTVDDTFSLARDGVRHELVLVDTAQALYRTKDEMFVRLQYLAGTDSWTLTTKDGTRYRLGYNTDSKARTVAADLVTPLTRRYHLDEMKTTSGVAVRHAYTKQIATLANGQSYDQAVYPDTITWAYASDSLVGASRQVTFVYGDRSDWPAAGATPTYFETKRLETLEVRVGASLVRKYVFAYDYSIDRAATYTWAGGAAGDLTLVSLAMVGSDGVTALPVLTLTYAASGRLATARNGLGGTVAYTYERLTSAALYSVCSAQGCADRGVCSDPDPWGSSTVVGYLLPTPTADTVPVYSVCATGGGIAHCSDWSIGTVSDGTNPTPLGYLLSPSLPQVPGTIALYRVCSAGCVASTAPNSGTLLGYIYTGGLDRYRVVNRAIDDGRGGVSTTAHTYTEPALGPANQFRGYASARATDPTGAYTDTWFLLDDARVGRVDASQTRSASAALYRDVSHTWTTSSVYPGVTIATLTRTDVSSCEPGAGCRATAETFEYDAHGNRSRTYVLGDVTVTGDERDERTDWVVDTTAWIHRPSRLALHDAAGAVLRERWLAYDGQAWGTVGARGLVTREERRFAGPLGSIGNPAVTYTWDTYGNRTGVTDAGGCATTTVLGADQAHPASSTSCLGHVTAFESDAGLGALTRQTDANGQSATYAYDALGRLTRVTGPLDGGSAYGSATYEYLDWGTPTIQRIVAYRTREHGTPTVRWTEESFDGRARVYRRRVQAPAGGSIITERTFDGRGLVAQRSAPYAPSVSPAWTTYTYDPLGRLTQVTHPGEARVTTAYAVGLRTITNERGSVRREFLDAHDRIARIEEVNGVETHVATYAWDAAGGLTGITNAAGSLWTLAYDALGRLVSLRTPNQGTRSYAYDARGNLTSRTDAAGQTVTFEYDTAGRRTAKNYPGGARVEWVYDEANTAAPYTLGRLTRVVDLATSTTFRYDPLGRTTQVSRLLDGTTYTLHQSWNGLDHVAMRTFPDGETVVYGYDEAGRLASIPGYVTALTYNARGQRTGIQYANGATTTLTYYDQAGDRRSLRLKALLTTGGGGTLQSLGFTYDDAGNLVRIVDNLGTAGRVFAYDSVGRLTVARGWPSGASEEFQYDATGNLLFRGPAVYAYSDPMHPAAVAAAADGRSWSYNANGNAVSASGLTLGWDADHRLRSLTSGAAGTVTFDYDADGGRVRKTSSAGVARMPFPGYEVDPSGVVTKAFGFATRKGSGPPTFRHEDHLGRTHVVTDESGVTRQVVEYGAWGEITRIDGSADLVDHGGAAGRDVPATRLYDPVLGRFLDAAADLVRPGPLGRLNEYSYRANNPVTSSPGQAAWRAEDF